MKGTEEQESKDRESRRRAKILMKSSGMRFVVEPFRNNQVLI